jgi:hypothetical protein
MKRRDFIKSSLAASAAATLPLSMPNATAAEGASGRELYEWRMYRIKAGADHALLDSYLEKALIPALNRLGSNPVGVFTEIEPKDDPAVFVLIPYGSAEAFVASSTRLAADAAHLKAGAEYLETVKAKPAFARIDSWFLRAFAGMPKIELPSYCREKKPRVFEVRTYESYSEQKAIRKMEMFDDGEIQIMKDVELGPIFWGQALAGANLPHLVYMLSAETREAHKAHFGAFVKDPRWKKMAADQKYADTVSKIYTRMLQPAPFSQI